MEDTIGGLVAVVLLVLVGARLRAQARRMPIAEVRRQRMAAAERLLADREPTPLTEYRNRLAARGSDSVVAADYVDCPCCGCPMLNRADPLECELCEWTRDEADPDALESARRNFLRYGTAYSPEEAAEWGGAALPPEAIATKQRIVAACEAARRGELDPPAWWRRVCEHWEELGEHQHTLLLEAAQEVHDADDATAHP